MKALLLAALTSIVVYASIFIFVVDKPLSVGQLAPLLDKKNDVLRSTVGKKIVIIAGSNGGFSHRCKAMEAILSMSCANMSLNADISLSFLIDNIQDSLAPGDVVYLPLEYDYLTRNKVSEMSGGEVPYLVRHRRSYLLGRGAERALNAVFYFDAKFLISSIIEMTLKRVGYSHKQRYDVKDLTKQGDWSGHTQDASAKYREHLKTLTFSIPDDIFSKDSYAAQEMLKFMEWAHENNILLIGGLPTVLDDGELPAAEVRDLCHFYIEHGHRFIALSNLSQYGRAAFYDTGYHLNEPTQIEHSKSLAYEIRSVIEGRATGGCELL
jgi:hypothetical protein